MKLNPVDRDSHPSYPVRTGKDSMLRRWVRRSLVAAFASGALWMGGCYGASPYHERPDDPTPTSEIPTDVLTILEVVVEQPPLPEDPEPMDGGMMAPTFTCGAAEDWYIETAPAYLEGSLCDTDPSVASLDVSAEADYVVSFGYGGEYTFLSIRDPAGEEIAEIGPDMTSVVMTMTEGRWTLVATPADPMNNATSWFAVQVDYAP